MLKEGYFVHLLFEKFSQLIGDTLLHCLNRILFVFRFVIDLCSVISRERARSAALWEAPCHDRLGQD